MNRPQSLNLLDANIEDVAALEYILLGDLRDLVDEPFDKVTQRWLKAVIDALLETLAHAFDHQDDDEFWQEVVDRDPNWSRYITRLNDERRGIFTTLQSLRQELDDFKSMRSVVPELRGKLKQWMLSITALHRHERRLLQTAFNLDVGTGD